MVGKGVATIVIAIAIVTVVLVGAVFGYMYLLPANQQSSTTQGQPSSVSTTQSSNSTTQGNIEISNATLSSTALSVTIQNMGSQAVSVNSLLVTPGTGCPSITTATTSQTNQTRTRLTAPVCLAGAIMFLVQSNSTLRPVTTAQFNFTSRSFNSTSRSFNSTSFTRTFSGSGNFSRTFSGNFPGNFSSNSGFQLAAGQSVTLTYSGGIGSGVTAGSPYTIMVMGRQAEAQTTISAS